jgi:hypothetical protein
VLLRTGQWGFASAVLLLALALPAAAQYQSPKSAVCQEMHDDIDYYYNLWQGEGTPKQKQVWRQQYMVNVWRHGQARCPKNLHGRNLKKTQPAEAQADPTVHVEHDTDPVSQ